MDLYRLSQMIVPQGDDATTLELMSAYYEQLLAGENRVDALRNVQLAMLRQLALRHPCCSASSGLSGDWRSLPSERLSMMNAGVGD